MVAAQLDVVVAGCTDDNAEAAEAVDAEDDIASAAAMAAADAAENNQIANRTLAAVHAAAEASAASAAASAAAAAAAAAAKQSQIEMDEEPLSMKDSVAAHLPEWQVLHGTTAARSLESQSHHHPAAPGQRQQPRQMARSTASVAQQQPQLRLNVKQ